MEHLEAAGLATFPQKSHLFFLFYAFYTARQSQIHLRFCLCRFFRCFLQRWADALVARGISRSISGWRAQRYLKSLLCCCCCCLSFLLSVAIQENAGTRHQRRRERGKETSCYTSALHRFFGPGRLVESLMLFQYPELFFFFFNFYISCSSMFLGPAICKVSIQRTRDFRNPDRTSGRNWSCVHSTALC